MDSSSFHPSPLYALDPLTRFSDRADDYVKYRPSYPSESIDQVLNSMGDPASLTIADIGAGTGISSRLFGDRGCQVIAIEPNAIMRNAAAPHPTVNYRAGTAEQTELADASVDIVACFQAFHWFNPDVALAEFRRILKPNGRLTLVWNNRDRSDALTDAFGDLMRNASHKHPALERPEFLPKNSIFPVVQEYRFSLTQPQTLEGLIGNAKSRSYIPREGTDYDRLLVDLAAFHQQWADEQGLVWLKYQTKVFIADLGDRSV